MASVRQIVDELRRRGVTVNEWPGWDGRGNEGVGHIDAKGGIIHHTGSNYGSAYPGLVVSTRPDLLGGMLCNFAGNEDGSLTVIGSGLAWHAAPATGPSLGALAPYGKSLNRNTVGLEIVYPGVTPMRPAQYRAALAFAKVVADLCAGGNVEAIRAHAEASPSGKWDPGYATGKTIDMAAFRRDAAAFAGLEEFDMTAQEDLDDLVAAVGAGNARAMALPSGQTLLGIVRAVPAQLAKIDTLSKKVDDLAAKVGSGTSGTVKLPTEFDLSAFAREITKQVVAELNKQARDGDPSTGPTS